MLVGVSNIITVGFKPVEMINRVPAYISWQQSPDQEISYEGYTTFSIELSDNSISSIVSSSTFLSRDVCDWIYA